MITLYHFSDVWEFDPSPFCLKVETCFRLAKIPFEKTTSLAALLKAPRKKLPYIIDDADVITDSEMIIEHLKNKYGVWLDDWLAPEQRAIAHTVRRMLEEGTYWAMAFERWMNPTVWVAYKPVMLGAIPKPMRNAAGVVIRRDYKRRFYGQGISRYSPAEIKRIGERDIGAVATLLAEKSYFLGNKPGSIDAVVFGFLGNAYFAPLETEAKKTITRHPNLTAYLDRIGALVIGPTTA
jgi:glutathione S-transferase